MVNSKKNSASSNSAIEMSDLTGAPGPSGTNGSSSSSDEVSTPSPTSSVHAVAAEAPATVQPRPLGVCEPEITPLGVCEPEITPLGVCEPERSLSPCRDEVTRDDEMQTSCRLASKRCFWSEVWICGPLRFIVSQNRRRYKNAEHFLDLDLTYITDRIIAMGYPADSRERLYRNSMAMTKRFLETYHKDHYKVFNLRGLYVYDISNFHNRVVSFEMTDHHPPRLEMMAPFCRMVHDYLLEDPKNIVAVHCKAGKGRTGVMICAYLCYINFYRNPRQNMDYYSIIRTNNNKGVTIPSQRRYIYYFNHLRQRGLNYLPNRVELVGVYLERPPKLKALSGKRGFRMNVRLGDVELFKGDDMWLSSDDWAKEEEAWAHDKSWKGPTTMDFYQGATNERNIISRRAWGWTIPKEKRVFLEGDVRIDIFSQLNFLKVVQHSTAKLGHIWFNTMFTCPAMCGGVYKHGDEKYAYKEGETTIARPIPEEEEPAPAVRPMSGSTSLPNSPPRSPKPRAKGGSLFARSSTRSPSIDARKPSRTRFHLNNVVRRLADATGRGSEPNIGRNIHDEPGRSIEERPGSSREEQAALLQSGPRRWEDDYELKKPAGQYLHCPDPSVIYGTKTPLPRNTINKYLINAHTGGLISDEYSKRRETVPCDESNPVPAAPEGRPNASGPNMIRCRRDEHVQCYPVYEIDRAFKNKNVNNGMKLYVVTRCVDEDDDVESSQCNTYMEAVRLKQDEKDKKKQVKKEEANRKAGNDPSTSCANIIDQGVAYTGADPDDFADPRARDPVYAKYFHKQRCDSISTHPSANTRCYLRDPNVTGYVEIDGKRRAQFWANNAAEEYLLTQEDLESKTPPITPKDSKHKQQPNDDPSPPCEPGPSSRPD